MNDAETEAQVTEIIEGSATDEAAAALIADLTGEPVESAALTVSLERHGYGDVLPPPGDNEPALTPPPAPVEPGHSPDPLPDGVEIREHGELGPVITDPGHDFTEL